MIIVLLSYLRGRGINAVLLNRTQKKRFLKRLIKKPNEIRMMTINFTACFGEQ